MGCEFFLARCKVKSLFRHIFTSDVIQSASKSKTSSQNFMVWNWYVFMVWKMDDSLRELCFNCRQIRICGAILIDFILFLVNNSYKKSNQNR